MTRLLESNFLTVNLKTLAGSGSKAQNTGNSATNNTANSGQQQAGTENISIDPNQDWAAVLTDRLKANNERKDDAKLEESEVEIEVFEEYFKSNFGDISKELLAIGPPLRATIKSLGFDRTKNPILGFISLKFVQVKLIKTGLLNKSTFLALAKALTKNLIAHSEFFNKDKQSVYNIIYCPALYKKSATEIEEYLTLQSKILSFNASQYTAKDKIRNRKTFIYIDKIEELNKEKRVGEIKNFEHKELPAINNDKVQLNGIELAKTIVDNWNMRSTDSEARSHLNAKAQRSLVDKLNSPSEIFAAIQYISMNTESKAAVAALSNEYFRSIPAEQVIKAVQTLASRNIMPKGHLAVEEADAIVDMLLGKLHK